MKGKSHEGAKKAPTVDVQGQGNKQLPKAVKRLPEKEKAAAFKLGPNG